MKKFLSLLLVAILLLGLCACAPQGDSQASFQVGYGKADITPKNTSGVILGGHAQRESTGLLEYLYAIVVAVTDPQGNTLLLITSDLSGDNEYALAKSARQAINKKFNIPEDHIMVGATHNHNAPNTAKSENAAYVKLWNERVLEAVQAALDDRKPAQMYIGTTETENLTFTRRYWLENGMLRGDNYNYLEESPIKEHETQADQEMQLVKFTREGGKDIIMMNWQAHAHKLGYSTEISTDYPGPFRDAVDKELDCLSVFYQGAAGNLNPRSEIKGEDTFAVGEYKALGKKLAEYVVAAQSNMKQVQTGNVQVKQIQYEGTVNHTQDNLSSYCQQIAERYKSTGDQPDSIEFGKQWGIYGHMEASAILYRMRFGDTTTLELDVISIGDVSFVTMPVEFFDTTGKQIKDQTPFEMTVLMGHTNGDGRYVPTREGYQNGGYEAYNSVFVPGTAEACVEEYLKALNELHKTK